MAKSQNKCGACPWGTDAATALKAERRRGPQAPVEPDVASARSEKVKGPKVVEVDVESRMMQLIEKCLEKKVLEIDLKRTAS